MAKYLDLGGLSTLWAKIKAALAKKQDAISAGRRISVSSGGTVSVPVHDLTATIDTAGQCAELFKFTVPSGSAACVKFRFVCFNGNNKGVQNGEVSLRYYNNGTTCTFYEKSSTWSGEAFNASFAVRADADAYNLVHVYAVAELAKCRLRASYSEGSLAWSNYTTVNGAAETRDDLTAIASERVVTAGGAVGSSTHPIYIDEDGKPQPCPANLSLWPAADAGKLVAIGTSGGEVATDATVSGDTFTFPGQLYANGNEKVVTARYLAAENYAKFPEAGQGITINTGDDGQPIILVETAQSGGWTLFAKNVNAAFPWRVHKLQFDNMGRLYKTGATGETTGYGLPVPADAGTAGYVLASQGSDAAPVWKPANTMLWEPATAYTGSEDSGKYRQMFYILASSTNANFNPVFTARCFLCYPGGHGSCTVNVYYRRSSGALGTLKGHARWDGPSMDSKAKFYAYASDSGSGAVVLGLYALLNGTYVRLDVNVEHFSAVGSTANPEQEASYSPSSTGFNTELPSGDYIKTAALTAYGD